MLTPLRVFLLCFVSALYALAAIRFSLPPHSWLEAYIHRKYDLHDKVLHHRPAFRGVERSARLSFSLSLIHFVTHAFNLLAGTVPSTSTGPPRVRL